MCMDCGEQANRTATVALDPDAKAFCPVCLSVYAEAFIKCLVCGNRVNEIKRIDVNGK